MFFYNRNLPNVSKAENLKKGAFRMHLRGDECVYVGDQPADEEAARTAGFQFLGVTYGWGIVKSRATYPTAENVRAMERKLIASAGSIVQGT